MNLLLINPPHLIRTGNVWKKIARCLPPLGLGYIASFLENKGVKVAIIDFEAEGLDISELKSRIKQANPDYIGITATTVVISSAIEIAEIARQALSAAKIVIGGVHPTISPDEVLLKPCVDYVVRGEGEETLLELLRGEPLDSIKGLSYRLDDKIIHNPLRDFIVDLDSLPHPAYHLLPMEKYRPSTANYRRLPATSIVASRGCPGRCTFCYTDVLGRRTRFRSAENIVSEIKLLRDNYGIKEISFYDDTFTANRQVVLDLCRLLKEQNLDITWACMSRIDMVDSALLKEMNAAGCHQIGYGIESADETILKNIKKPIPLERVKKVVRETHRAGIDVRGMFMFGNPGETKETMQKTLDFAVSLNLDIAVFNITTPYPGTEMFNWAKDNGYLLTLDWNDYDLSKCVMRLPTVEPKEVEHFYKYDYKKFYLRPPYIFKKLVTMRNFIDLRSDFRFFTSLVKEWFQK